MKILLARLPQLVISALLGAVFLMGAACDRAEETARPDADAGATAPDAGHAEGPNAGPPAGTDLDGDGVPDIISVLPETEAARRSIDAFLSQRYKEADSDPVPELLDWLRSQTAVRDAMTDADHSTVRVRFRDGTVELLVIKSFEE